MTFQLTDEVREATQGRSHFYSQYFHQECNAYHHEGRNWPASRLTRFFREGLLQYYVGTFCGFDFHYNYIQDIQLAEYDVNKFKTLFTVFSIPQGPDVSPVMGQKLPEKGQQWSRVLDTCLKKIKTVTPLVQLGAEFQRVKQVLEDLRHQLEDQGLDESKQRALMNELVRLDKDIDMIQFNIYNWVRYYIFEVQAFIQAHGSQIEAVLEHLREFTPTEEPPFLHDQHEQADEAKVNLLLPMAAEPEIDPTERLNTLEDMKKEVVVEHDIDMFALNGLLEKNKSVHPMYENLLDLSAKIKRLADKYEDFSKKIQKKYVDACQIIYPLHAGLCRQFHTYVQEVTAPNYDFSSVSAQTQLNAFKRSCFDLLKDDNTVSILQQHRGCGQLLHNIAISILTLGIKPLYYKYKYGQFFPQNQTHVKTESEEKLGMVEKVLFLMNPV